MAAGPANSAATADTTADGTEAGTAAGVFWAPAVNKETIVDTNEGAAPDDAPASAWAVAVASRFKHSSGGVWMA